MFSDSFLSPNVRSATRVLTWFAVATVVATSWAVAQSTQSAERRGGTSGPTRAQSVVQVLAEDMATGESLGAFARGGTLVVKPGQRVRLRMQTKPNANARSAHYPSTRFDGSGSQAIRVERTNDEIGSLIFTARKARSYRASILYEILENWPIPPREKEGRIYVEVHAADQEGAEPEPDVDVQQRRGATLFRDPGFRGDSVRVFDNGLNLSSLNMDDVVSSVRLDEGCYVVLYELPGLRGESQIIRYDVGELNGAVGDNRASSIRVVCEDQAAGGAPNADTGVSGRSSQGVMVYRDIDFRGDSMVLVDGDYPTLRGTRIDNGQISSVAVGTGCVVWMFEGTDYRGRSLEVRESVSDMRRTSIGNDNVSSVRVICN